MCPAAAGSLPARSTSLGWILPGWWRSTSARQRVASPMCCSSVVRDPAIHAAVLEQVGVHGRSLGLGLAAATVSPLLGPEGNREFFLDLEVPTGWGPTKSANTGATTADLPAEWHTRFRELAGL